MTRPLRFTISSDVRALGVRGAFAVIEGLDNRRRHPAWDAFLTTLHETLRRELVPDFVAGDPVLAGFRALHDRIGRSNRRFPASAEALVLLFQRRGIVPRISPVVDVYNAVSLETRLSLGAHDTARVSGDIVLGMTRGGESFRPLGEAEASVLGAGEYAYMDDADRVICRLEHRQCEETKVTPDTHTAFFILQGNAATGRAVLESSLDRLLDLAARFCGGRAVERWILD